MAADLREVIKNISDGSAETSSKPASPPAKTTPAASLEEPAKTHSAPQPVVDIQSKLQAPVENKKETPPTPPPPPMEEKKGDFLSELQDVLDPNEEASKIKTPQNHKKMSLPNPPRRRPTQASLMNFLPKRPKQKARNPPLLKKRRKKLW